MARRSAFLKSVDSIIDNSILKRNFTILVKVENEVYDQSMYPLPDLKCYHEYHINRHAPKGKIAAINRGLTEYLAYNDFDIIVNMSDDMVFTQYGFDNIIRKEFETLDEFIHFPDGNRKDLCTMSIMGINYFKRDAYIYHPSYKSVYCDNEAHEVAEQRGCYKFVDRQIFEHRHPAYGKGTMDKLYSVNDYYYSQDEQTYLNRKANGFIHTHSNDTK
jgi:hypothetical protein